MIKYLSAHRATIVALVGVTLTYLTAKYGMSSPGPIQQGLQLAIPLAAVLGVHVSPSPFSPSTPATPVAAPQAKHSAPPSPPTPPTPPSAAPAAYIPAPTEPKSFTIDTREGLTK